MYGNVNAYILWLILVSKYLNNEYNLKIIKAYSCIFYKKYDYGKLELMISFHVDGVFMVGKQDKLEKIKEMIKMKFNIQESQKVKKFLRVYY